ncbi:MAG: IS110 family transposase [Pseudobdellovibrionaceae bacterium]|nr:IS110 family transposase [Pseudobdellovibrionaceae bacterium]
MNSKTISYAGKNVYIGIDVHKETYVVACIVDDEIVKRASTHADPTSLAHSLQSWFEGAKIHSAYEASYFGFVLHRALAEVGIDNIVVNAASIKVAANDRVKTDRRDAKKIAWALSKGDLVGIHIPTEDEELSRLLPRTRAQLVEHRGTIERQIKAKLHQFGLMPLGSTRRISSRYLRELEAMAIAIELKTVLGLLFAQWRFLTTQLLQERRLLRQEAKKRVHLESVYKSVPGIGQVGAAVLATELGDMSRFANEKGLFRYTGLTPTESTWGETVRRGHISRQGAGRLRGLLVEAAWRAVSKDIALGEIFNRIAATRGKKRAIVAIARRLIGRIRACFRTGTLYAVGTPA